MAVVDPNTGMFMKERDLAERNYTEAQQVEAEAEAGAKAATADGMQTGKFEAAAAALTAWRTAKERTETARVALEAAMTVEEQRQAREREKASRSEIKVRRAHSGRLNTAIDEINRAVEAVATAYRTAVKELSALQAPDPDATAAWPVGWWRLNREIVADIERAIGASFGPGRADNLARVTVPLVATIKTQIDAANASLPPVSDTDTTPE